MTEKEYVVLPPDRHLATGMEKTTLQDATSFFSNTDLKGWRLVRVSNYPCGTDDYGTTLYPIVSILKVKQ